MPSLGFQKRWVPDILSGRKRQTIRRARNSVRQRQRLVFWPGCPLYLGIGARTKHYRRIGTATCVMVDCLRRQRRGRWHLLARRQIGIRMRFDKTLTLLTADELARLAQLDGFASVAEFEDWFDQYPPGIRLDCIIWGESFWASSRHPAPGSGGPA